MPFPPTHLLLLVSPIKIKRYWAIDKIMQNRWKNKRQEKPRGRVRNTMFPAVSLLRLKHTNIPLICAACWVTHNSLSRCCYLASWDSTQSYYPTNMNHLWSCDALTLGLAGRTLLVLHAAFDLSTPHSYHPSLQLILSHAAAISTFNSSPFLPLPSHICFSRFLRWPWRSSARHWFEDYAR